MTSVELLGGRLLEQHEDQTASRRQVSKGKFSVVLDIRSEMLARLERLLSLEARLVRRLREVRPSSIRCF